MNTSLKMKRSTLASAVALLPLMLPATGFAAVMQVLEPTQPQENITKSLEIYGAARLSVDYLDSDVGDMGADASPLLSEGDVSVSSNTSMFGFRGEIPLEGGYKVLWQFEQQVDLDDTDDGDVWTTRDSFVGLESGWGTFLVGRVNTPFKNMGVAYLGYFNTTVADSHAILGAPSGGPGGRLDLLGSNSVTWQKSFGSFGLSAQYATDQAGSHNAADDNGRDSVSAAFDWDIAGVALSGAYINYSEAGGIGGLDAYRVGAKYRFGPAQVGGIFENIDADDRENISRQAYGLQLNYTLMPRWVAVSQWNHADESDAGDDEADQFSVGLFHAFNPQILLHVMYTTTRNGDNAAYRGVDYAHGDKLGTLPGHDPQAVSIGGQLKF